MKKVFYTLVFVLVSAFALSACSDENIKPVDGNTAADKCQFGGPGCPKG